MRLRLIGGLALACVTTANVAQAADPVVSPPPPPAALVEAPPPPHPLEWKPEWSRAGALDYVVTGVGLATALTFAILPPRCANASCQPTPAILSNPFDDSVRNTLRLASYDDRHAAGDVSDVLLSLMTTYPVLFDAFALGYGYWRSADAAYQMTVINAEALAISAGIQGATNYAVSRERPYGSSQPQPCSTFPPSLGECNGPTRYRSFFSGHATISFTAAGLTCSHHLNLHLFGNGGDAAACIVALVAATSISVLRVMGDYHYATDVISGAAVGSAVGFIVPAFHYAKHKRVTRVSDLEWHVAPSVGGIGIAGTW